MLSPKEQETRRAVLAAFEAADRSGQRKLDAATFQQCLKAAAGLSFGVCYV